jgi:hypothetical protein
MNHKSQKMTEVIKWKENKDKLKQLADLFLVISDPTTSRDSIG